MITYRFYQDKRRLPEGATEAPIKLVLTLNRVRAEIPTGISVKIDKFWNRNLQKIVGHPNADELNFMLEAKKIKVMRIIDRLQYENKTTGLSIAQIKNLVMYDLFPEKKNNEPKKPKLTFIAHMKKFMEHKSKGTYGVYDQTLTKLRKYDSEADALTFEDITVKWLKDFEAHMSETMSKNARNIHLRNIRAIFNDALDDELISCYPFRKFKIRPEPTRKRALSLANLRRVFDYPAEEYAVIYRDMFKLIFLLIGINTIDLHRLKEITPEGRIEFLRAKTARDYSIKVEPEAMAIIDKYKGKNGLLCIADRWTDHVNFRHQMNTALKNMGTPVTSVHGKKDKKKKGEFPELSTYWARHTWATIARQIGVSKDDIRLALGHGAKTVTDIYIDEDREKIDIANRKVIDWVLYGKK